MSVERDKYLTEAMGGFCHYSVMTGAGNECSCGKWWPECINKHPNFSTWEGFGKLMEYCENEEWWLMEFMPKYDKYAYMTLTQSPDCFADAVYSYLKEQK